MAPTSSVDAPQGGTPAPRPLSTAPPGDGPAGADAVVAEGETFRREIFAHCYRMTGSVHEAEDLVQETYLRAWRGRDGFAGRASVRTWLHRIATNTCLTALEGRARRPLPTGLGAPASDPRGVLESRPEVPWLEPVPDAYVGLGAFAGAAASDVGEVVARRDQVRLAFVAALQFLTPQQRAVLLLREVLAWRAAEVAETLGTSEAAVNSLLQRARAELARVRPAADVITEPDSPRLRDLLDRYMRAFEAYDLDALVEVFTSDATWEMPPYTGWYEGPREIAALIATNCPASGSGDMRMVPVGANGQPAFGLYMRGGHDGPGSAADDGHHRAFQLQVLDVGEGGVAHVATFFDPSLFEAFGLPAVLEG